LCSVGARLQPTPAPSVLGYNGRHMMKDNKQNIRYLGFESTEDGRRFKFSITGVGRESKQVSLIIPALMFTGANKITFQESAKICYEKLRVLLECEKLEEQARIHLTGDDIAQFRHIPRGRARFPKTEN
jgi:hypothetical protein